MIGVADAPAPVVTADPEMAPWTPAQRLQRQRWAKVMCSGAQNETSRAMARRLCKSWFKDCPCIGSQAGNH